MAYKCPACGKILPDTLNLARHFFGTGDKAHKEWVKSKGHDFVELLLVQTMESGNKGYKALADLLEQEAEKVD